MLYRLLTDLVVTLHFTFLPFVVGSGFLARRHRLHAEIVFLAEHSDEVLGRWASVMLNSEEYAEILDRHVELVGSIAWIAGLLPLQRVY